MGHGIPTKNERMGQGKESAKKYLSEKPDTAKEIETKIKQEINKKKEQETKKK